MRKSVAVIASVIVIGTLNLLAPDAAQAACARDNAKSFVQNAHDCVGWISHPNDALRWDPATDGALAMAAAGRLVTGVQPTNADLRGAIPGGLVANQLLSLIVEIAVDRARRQGLAVVHSKIQKGVCEFSVPEPFPLRPPVLPETCGLIQSTDLLSLVGQARALRTSLTGDITRIAAAEFNQHFSDLPPFNQALAAALALVRRTATPDFRLRIEDVRPIGEAFVNAAWATEAPAGTFTPIMTPTRQNVALQVALSAARVYVQAIALRAPVQQVENDRLSAGTAGAPPAALSAAIDIAAIIEQQARLCTKVYPAKTYPMSPCPQVPTALLDWTNLAVRALTVQTADLADLKGSLRASVQLVLDTLLEVQANRLVGGVADPAMANRLAVVTRVKAIAVAAVDTDLPRLITGLAQIARTSLLEACNEDCADRRKVSALLSGIAAYASTYVEVPDGASEAEAAKLIEVQHAARKQALESVIDAATDRRGRSGDRVWSLGTGVGVTFAGQQRAEAATTWLNESLQLSVPLGVAYQRLPSDGWKGGIPWHVMATVLELGSYVGKDKVTDEQPDWQAIFAPGIQVGIPLSVSPSNFFVIGGSLSFTPHFKSEPDDRVRGAVRRSIFVNFFVPLWDFN